MRAFTHIRPRELVRGMSQVSEHPDTDFNLPVVAIVGRPNVGKSSLFNAFLGRRVAIVDPTPGTTRDRLSAVVTYSGRTFELHDTAGIVGRAEGELERNVQFQVDVALAIATVVVFVVDASEGLTGEDARIAERLRKTGARTILVANKLDRRNAVWNAAEFHQLGLGAPLPTAAVHRRGIDELRDAVAAALPQSSQPIQPPLMRLAIVGKQNVGKSTLANRFAKKERVVVSPLPGTTRDAIEIPCRYKNSFFVVIDTAGFRKKGKEQATTDLWSRQRAQQAIRSADVVLFLIDAVEKIGMVEKSIAAEIVERGIPCVICINKWDMVRGEASARDYDKYVARTLPSLSFAPISFISALQGTNVTKTLDLARDLFRQAHTRVPTAELNAVVHRICDAHLPGSTGAGLARVYYAAQIGTAPVRIVLFVNDPRSFSAQYVRFLEHKLRNELPFAEIPIKLILRGRSRT